jgi:hypothetical protein
MLLIANCPHLPAAAANQHHWQMAFYFCYITRKGPIRLLILLLLLLLLFLLLGQGAAWLTANLLLLNIC